jgi:hypothetical protein
VNGKADIEGRSRDEMFDEEKWLCRESSYIAKRLVKGIEFQRKYETKYGIGVES